MYDKFKFFSLNSLGGFNEGFLKNLKHTENGLIYTAKNGEAIFCPLSFDSQENGCTWHKVKMWIEVPEGMYFEIFYFASDYKSYGEDGKDLDMYMMDNSISDDNKEMYLKDFWKRICENKKPIVNAEDALFINAQGRYLFIMLKMKYNYLKEGSNSLTIKKIRIYYPRMSFLDYLPAVYQEDPESKDFLERFLSIFSTIYDEMEESIDNMAKNFDADTVEGDFLKWLSSWLAIAADDRWDQNSLRELTKRAPEIYKIRGTKRALEKMIRIYTGETPIIIEFFQYKELLMDAEVAENLIKLYGDDPYTFSVLVRSACVKENHQKIAVKKILQEEKPAYTKARLIILKSSIELDEHTYLGINSNLSGGSPLLLDPEKSVLYNSIL